MIYIFGSRDHHTNEIENTGIISAKTQKITLQKSNS